MPPPPAGWPLWIDDDPEPVPRPYEWPLRTGLAVVWLLFLVAGLVSGGVTGLLVFLGLPLVAVGALALAVGRIRWAWLTRRLTAGVAAGTGLALLVIASAAGTPQPAKHPDSTVSAPTSGASATGGAATPSPTPTPTPRYHVAVVDGVPLPDAAITTGSTFADASAAAVCDATWVNAHSAVDTAAAEQVFDGYGIAPQQRASYVIDRLIPVGLGGDGTVANLWPQPRTAAGAQAGAAAKDTLESHLHDLVCAHAVPLATAQHDIAVDWPAAYTHYIPIAVPRPTTRPATPPPAPRPSRTRPASPPPAPPAPKPAPTRASPPPPADPPDPTGGPTARCNDGTYSYSRHRSGTCSHHHGVAVWINPPPS